MFERTSGILLIAGLGFFALAFLSNGLLPALMYADQEEKTVEQILDEQMQRHDAGKQKLTVVDFFKELADQYEGQFKQYYVDPEERDQWTFAKNHWDEEKWKAKCAEAIRFGRKIYAGEACWHCHSQFVRPVSNEEKRWGPVAKSEEYNNELQKPVLFGTRRIGPDLSREGGIKGNSWHATHFYDPRLTSPASVMPRYTWFFDGDAGKPNKRGIAMITYMQFQGSWLEEYPHFTTSDSKENQYEGRK
jgi:hypothetical protein